MARQTLQENAIDVLGLRITGGDYVAGQILRMDGWESEFDVSRTVVREALKVLESMSLIEIRRSVGVTVLDKSRWNVFDPRVIRWRLAGDERAAQMRSLAELRVAIEPIAAGLAAINASKEQRQRMTGLIDELNEASQEPNAREAIIEGDILFHTLVLESSGNEMFVALSDAVSEVLRGRFVHNLLPNHMQRPGEDVHAVVAHAIAEGDSARAESAMRELLSELVTELSHTLSAAAHK
jgi:DNA-binding FadR family transcriptional regulator